MSEQTPDPALSSRAADHGPVAAVLFDWGGTLTPWHRVDVDAIWAETYAALAFPGDGVAAGRLARTLVAADAAASLRGRRQHLSATLEEILVAGCHDAGVDVNRVATPAAARAYRAAWEPHTFTDPQVGPLWRWLRGYGIKVGVLSNTIWSRDYHRGVFRRDGVLDLIDGDVYTSEIDHVKPHPEAFRLAAASVQTEPSRCVYVGDRLYEDVWGPTQVGMATIYLPHTDLPPEQRVDVEATPSATVQGVSDVAEVVARWRDQGSPHPSDQRV